MSNPLRNLSNDQLLTRLRELARRDHALEADLLAHLGEVDRRRLYAREGYPSLFRYCVETLNFSEAVAYLRIGVARRACELPELLAAIRGGDLHLTGARLLAPHLTAENARELIAAAQRKTKLEIEGLLADRFPKPDQPTHVRRLPQAEPARRAAEAPGLAPAPQGVSKAAALPLPGGVLSSAPVGEGGGGVGAAQVPPAPSPAPHPSPMPALAPAPTRTMRAHNEPLGLARYRVSFTLDEDTHEKLEALRAWMRHRIPDGDIGAILARAIAVLHAQEHKRKSADTTAPHPRKASSALPSRHVPAEVRRAVWRRDGGRCTYRSPGGRRCGAREFLELDHAVPWERVRTHSIENIRLRCRTHNDYAACQAFGEAHMARFRKALAPTCSADRAEGSHDPTRSGTSCAAGAPDRGNGRPRRRTGTLRTLH